MAKNKPWTGKWIIKKNLKGGGQGDTHQVECASSGIKGCLKVIRNSNSAERRGRFRREVVALQTVEHSSVPKVLDENTSVYRSD